MEVMIDTIVDTLGVPRDQLYFFTGQTFCLACSFAYRKLLPPWNTSATTRHLVAMVIGIFVGFLSFGMQFGHMLLQATVCFLGMKLLPHHIMHKVVFTMALSYLMLQHIYRAYILPVDVLYCVDVSGPLMILTQRIISLAFSLHDGRYGNQEKLSPLQKKLLVRKTPSPLEYFSYVCYFQGVLVGPMCFYSDYVAYIEGTDICEGREKDGQNNNKFSSQHAPSPFDAVVQKLLIMGFWVGFHVTFRPSYPESLNSDAEFTSKHSFVYLIWYMLVSMLCCRAKYYIAFSFGDVIANASGLGFNGYYKNGVPKWDRVTNINIAGIEFATSPKTYIDNWNIQSAVWLRHVSYDRVPVQKRLATVFLSALWHGCYPGYYMSFLFLAPVTEVARLMRRKLRPYFQQTSEHKFTYDVITWFSTQVTISYIFVPFTVLYLGPTFRFYSNFYWFLHILVFVLYFVLPSLPTPKMGNQTKSQSSSVNSMNQHQSTVNVAVKEKTENQSTENIAVENRSAENSATENQSIENISMKETTIENHLGENIVDNNQSKKNTAVKEKETVNQSLENNAMKEKAIGNHATGNIAVKEKATESQSIENNAMKEKAIGNHATGNIALKENAMELQSVENITLDNQSTENITVVNQSTGNITVENQATENIKVENQSTENITVENQSTGNITVENHSTGSITVENQSTDDITVENQSTGNNVVNEKVVENESGNEMGDGSIISESLMKKKAL